MLRVIAKILRGILVVLCMLFLLTVIAMFFYASYLTAGIMGVVIFVFLVSMIVGGFWGISYLEKHPKTPPQAP